MIDMDRKELLDLFDKCGKLARYHIAEGRNCVMTNPVKALEHKDIVDKYIAVREDILKLLTDGS